MSKLINLVHRASWTAAGLVLAAPAFAQGVAPTDPQVSVVAPERRLAIGGVFTHAKPLIMLIFAGLIVAIAYAAFVYIRGLIARRGQPVGGLVFLSALSAGGPLIGVFGAAYGLLDMSIGIANVRPEATLIVLAPGFAEAMLSISLGLLAGAIATVGHRHLSGRGQAMGQSASVAPADGPPTHLARTIG
jgi:hypothetical protein